MSGFRVDPTADWLRVEAALEAMAEEARSGEARWLALVELRLLLDHLSRSERWGTGGWRAPVLVDEDGSVRLEIQGRLF